MAAATAPAAGTGKGKRKRPLSEDDVYLLLNRYAPATILTALQEVAQHAEGRRIDWKALVGKSATGITSAREYQMLWRHFAYQHELAESVDAGASPLGDDSDLECELEPIPNPSEEALSEASSLAKILISGSSREQASGHRVNLEVPAQNSTNEKIVRVPSDKQLAQNHRLTSVTCPVSNSKQAQTGPSPDALDANGASKKKKKVKTWSKEEDADLAAGVQKYGEGNWRDILSKCNFDTTRTTDQLSQRWALICKRSGSSKPAITKQVSVTSSEERQAAIKAFSMALDYDYPPRKPSALRSGAQQHIVRHTPTVFGPTLPEVKSTAVPSPAVVPVPVPVQVPVSMPVPVTVQVQVPVPQGQQAPIQAAPPKASSNKTRNNSKKQAIQQNPTIGPSSIQAAAIAAGGRIATPKAAASLFKAAQSKNAVHIRSRVAGSLKSSATPKAPVVAVEPGTQLGGAGHLEPPNTITTISGPSVLTTHGTEQVIGVSEVVAANPPGPSSVAHLLETEKASSTSPVPASCDSEELDDDSTFCVVTMDDLFPEDAKQPETLNPKDQQPDAVDPNEKQPDPLGPNEKQPDSVGPKEKQTDAVGPKAKQPDTVDPKVEEIIDSKDADMIEFDRFVAAQGASVNLDCPDAGKAVKTSPGTQGSAGCQKKQLKSVPMAGRSNPVSPGAPTTGKKTKSPVPHQVTPTPTGTLRVLTTAQNRTVGRKAAATATAGGQPPLKKQAMNTKGNQTPNNMAVGVSSGVPASNQARTLAIGASKVNSQGSSQASTVVNGAGKATLGNSQVSMVANGARKANPPSSSQASLVANGARKATPPGSNQASTVANGSGKANPPGSSQASTVVNGPGRANLPGSSQASTVVNGPGRANPPASSQASTVVNGPGRANPPGSSQASTVVNGPGRANPPGSIQASTVVNGPGRAKPPGSIQASTVANGPGRVNPPGSSQASTVVNGGSKATPQGTSQASKVMDGATKANPPSQ